VGSESTQPRVSCQCSHRQHATPFRGPREGKCSCHLPPATAQGYSGSRILPVAQPGTDVMRDVLRLVDADLLQNCNGHSTTVLRRQRIFSSVSFDKKVCLSDISSCPVEWQPSEARFEAGRSKKARATYSSRPCCNYSGHPAVSCGCPTELVPSLTRKRRARSGPLGASASQLCQSGARFPFPAESGNGGSPIPGPGRFGKRGFPPCFPAKSGIGGTGIGDFRVWGTILNRRACY
jgi:hypothetical protein